jgi:predicted sulfurtransferase
MVLSNEINHNISKIHMQYDGEALAPKWQLDNLLQALYFAIFYMKPGVKMYKRCANPNCKRDVFFLTDRTKTNKEYCCTQCRSAAGQRRRRLAEQAEKEAQP